MQWQRVPIPPTWLGPRCIPGPGDNARTPNACHGWEHGGQPKSPPSLAASCNTPAGCTCEPCPETPGSDCSRCGQGTLPQFPPLANWTAGKAKGTPIVKGGYALGILDVLKVPAGL